MRIRRILTSLVVVAVAGGAAFLGTSAFFSDTETSQNNILQAGEIDLLVDNVQHYNGMVCAQYTNPGSYMWVPNDEVTLDGQSHPIIDPAFDASAITAYNALYPAQYPQAGVACDGSWRLSNLDDNTISGRFFNFLDIKPGDEGENTISLHVVNNDAWMCAAVGNVGPDSPEANDLAFQENMEFFAWWDDGDNIYNGDDVAITATPLNASELVDGKMAIADSSTVGGPIPGETTRYVGVAWCAGEMTTPTIGNPIVCDGAGMGNEAQGGQMTADIQFYAVQSRNNETFTCANGYTPVWPASPTPTATPLPEATVTSGTGWSPVDLDVLGGGAGKEWHAKSRNNNGNFEVAVGGANDANRDDADTTWVAETEYPFTLSYDHTTGNATYTAGGQTVVYLVGPGAFGRIGVNVKAPTGVTTTVSELALDIVAPLGTDTESVTGGTRHLLIDGVNLSQDWTLTGKHVFSAVGAAYSDENPAVQFSID